MVVPSMAINISINSLFHFMVGIKVARNTASQLVCVKTEQVYTAKARGTGI